MTKVMIRCAHCGLPFTPFTITENVISLVLQPCPTCIQTSYRMGYEFATNHPKEKVSEHT